MDLINELKKANEYVLTKMPNELHIIKNVIDEKIDQEQRREIHRKLSQYKNMKREVDELKKQYSIIQDKATKITSSIGDGIHASGVSDKVSNGALLAELLKQIEQNISVIDGSILEIEKFVCQIEDAEIREIIRYRFIEGLSWQQVTFKMSGYNESVPRMKYQRWLNRM